MVGRWLVRFASRCCGTGAATPAGNGKALHYTCMLYKLCEGASAINLGYLRALTRMNCKDGSRLHAAFTGLMRGQRRLLKLVRSLTDMVIRLVEFKPTAPRGKVSVPEVAPHLWNRYSLYT